MQMVRSFPLLFLVVFLTAASWRGTCHAIYYSWTSIEDFKGIDRYSLFLKGNLNYYRSDVEGRVAVGGNAHLKAFSIGEKATNSKYSLVVGGKLRAGGSGNHEGGQVNNGGIYSGKKVVLKRVGLPEGDVVSKSKVKLKEMTVEQGSVVAEKDVKLKNAFVKGDVTSGGKVKLEDSTVEGQVNDYASVDIQEPIDFDDIDLGDISQGILSNKKSGTVSYDNGQLLLECTDPLICYFNISATQIEDAWGIGISASSGKTVVINVKKKKKKSLVSENMAFRLLGGIGSANILYNLYGFKKITMDHIGLKGSILAPGATVNFFEGNMEGILMAQNLNGGSWRNGINGGQINVPVPEPSSLFLVFSALFLFGLFSSIPRLRRVLAR